MPNAIAPAKILMIEDNEGDIFLLRYALKQQTPDFELNVLRDGEAALQFIEDQRCRASEPQPCVIVLDLHLPKHDGTAILSAIKREPVLSHIHIVALTTLASPEDEADILRLGVRMYKTKPTNIDGWHALASEILDICHEPTLA